MPRRTRPTRQTRRATGRAVDPTAHEGWTARVDRRLDGGGTVVEDQAVERDWRRDRFRS